ncbi:3-phytase A [Ceratobasidium sp. AG-Ba]|nr:3-phytase A [Ceratobasidium sp. AG-Ba]QRV98604.1 3-phytase A [Ceratobasidium sp. AG-Ba]
MAVQRQSNPASTTIDMNRPNTDNNQEYRRIEMEKDDTEHDALLPTAGSPPPYFTSTVPRSTDRWRLVLSFVGEVVACAVAQFIASWFCSESHASLSGLPVFRANDGHFPSSRPTNAVHSPFPTNFDYPGGIQEDLQLVPPPQTLEGDCVSPPNCLAQCMLSWCSYDPVTDENTLATSKKHPTPPTYDPFSNQSDVPLGVLFPIPAVLFCPVAHLVAELGPAELLVFVETTACALLKWIQSDEMVAGSRIPEHRAECLVSGLQKEMSDNRSLAPRLGADVSMLGRTALAIGRVVDAIGDHDGTRLHGLTSAIHSAHWHALAHLLALSACIYHDSRSLSDDFLLRLATVTSSSEHCEDERRWARSKWRWDEITSTWVESTKPVVVLEYVPRATKKLEKKRKAVEAIVVSSDTEMGHPMDLDGDEDDVFAAIQAVAKYAIQCRRRSTIRPRLQTSQSYTISSYAENEASVSDTTPPRSSTVEAP